jgi:hypothetical protein
MRITLLSEYLVKRIAACAPSARFLAMRSASSWSASSSTHLEIRPMRSASSPSSDSQVSR